MSEVKRYNPELEKDIGLGLPCLSMLGNPYGEWVHYQDYAELKAQRDALAAEVSAIRDHAEDVYAAGYRHGHVNTVDGIAYVTPVEDEFYHNALQVMLEVETPATDAYLNSVRSEGAIAILCELLEDISTSGKGVSRWRLGFVDYAWAVVAEKRASHLNKIRAGEPS